MINSSAGVIPGLKRYRCKLTEGWEQYFAVKHIAQNKKENSKSKLYLSVFMLWLWFWYINHPILFHREKKVQYIGLGSITNLTKHNKLIHSHTLPNFRKVFTHSPNQNTTSEYIRPEAISPLSLETKSITRAKDWKVFFKWLTDRNFVRGCDVF